MKVLVSAYACEPGRGSELGVGWNWAIQAARHHDVWVLTQNRARQVIEDRLRDMDRGNLRFVYADLPHWTRRFARPMERTHYMLWQFLVLKRARRLHAEVGFDVVHHLTYNTIEGPGVLWRLGVPWVWGPVGGGQVPPKQLRQYFGKRWSLEVVRGLRKESLRFNPLVRLAARKAACIFTSNLDTSERLRELGAANLVREVEIGAAEPPPLRALGSRGNGPLQILWAGSLVPRKGPLLALDVAASLKMRGVDFRLRMAGKGYLQVEVETRCRDLGVDDRVELLGALPFEAMNELYDGGDAFLFTSLQDTNGSVVVEALSHGLPVVALDHHGAAEIVTPQSGIKVPVGTAAEVVEGLAGALERLATHADLRRQLSTGAAQLVLDRYLWEHKAPVLAKVYAEVTGRATSTSG